MGFKILIIKLGALGDVIRTTSILKGLKEKYPNCKIDWVTYKYCFELLQDNEDINNLIDFRNPDDVGEYDMVISLEDSIKASKFASSIKTNKLVGCYYKYDKIQYTDDSQQWFDLSLISRFGKEKADELKRTNKKTYPEIIASILGIKMGEYSPLPINKEFTENFVKNKNIEKGDLVVGLNTGAGKRWLLKRLSIDKTVELAEKIVNELGAKVILFGGPEEIKRNKEMINKVKVPIINAGCNNSLTEFFSLVNLCNAVVASDSLAMHVAIALKRQVVVFFGPTSAAEIELYDRGKKIIPDVDCYCCYEKNCNKKPNCIDVITVDSLFNAVKGVLHG